MQLNLNDIIGKPGSKKEFSFALTDTELLVNQTEDERTALQAEGIVQNRAGALEINGTLSVSITCSCDRCSDTVFITKTLPVTAYLTEHIEEDDDSGQFPILGGNVDLGEIFTTSFFLDFDQKILCTEDCLGLCHTCGANLNETPCTCPQNVDPRFEALRELL